VQRLYLVGFTADHQGVILTAEPGSKAGGYVMALDDELLARIGEAARRRGGGSDSTGERARKRSRAGRSGVESALSPREIQGQLRAGRSVAEVALEAGVEPAWVERFAGPVQAEQAAAVRHAGRLIQRDPQRGPSDRPVAESVTRNLADRGVQLLVDDLAEAWTAYLHHDTTWAVCFSYSWQGQHCQAEWWVDLHAGAVVAHNQLAADLGYLEAAPGAASAETDARVG